MKMRLLAGALAVSCGAFSSAYLVIDDFTTGDYSAEYSTLNNTQFTHQLGSMLGGVRWLTYTITQKQLAKSKYRVDVSEGSAMVSSDSGLRNTTVFDYGLTSQLGYNDLNLNLKASDKLNLNFYSNDLELTLMLGLRSAGQNFGDYEYITYKIGASENPFTYSINLSDFVGFKLSDTDQICLSFSNKLAGDYTLDSVELVPEPMTLGLLAAGIGALGLRRRNRK